MLTDKQIEDQREFERRQIQGGKARLHSNTKKIEEFTYKSEHHTKQRLKKEIGKHTEITLATDLGVYHLIPNPLNIDFNNDQNNV